MLKLVSKETFCKVCDKGYENKYNYHLGLIKHKLLYLIGEKYGCANEYRVAPYLDLSKLDRVFIPLYSIDKGINSGSRGSYLQHNEIQKNIYEILYVYNNEIVYIQSDRDSSVYDDYYISYDNFKSEIEKVGLSELYNKNYKDVMIHFKVKDIKREYEEEVNKVCKSISTLREVVGCEQEFKDIIIKQCKDRIAYLYQLRDKEIEKIKEE